MIADVISNYRLLNLTVADAKLLPRQLGHDFLLIAVAMAHPPHPALGTNQPCQLPAISMPTPPPNGCLSPLSPAGPREEAEVPTEEDGHPPSEMTALHQTQD